MKYVLCICALLGTSCMGVVDGEAPGPKGSAMIAGGGNPATGGAGGAPGSMTMGAPFSVRIGEPELLPFDVRVRRISNVLKVPVESSMFTEMLAKSVQLGDYDHAAGALPDNLWLARRLSTWADALTPICASAEMKAMFPALPDSAGSLIKAAWGRSATEQELSEINAAVSEAGLLPAESYEATCMAVFTAAEFVFR